MSDNTTVDASTISVDSFLNRLASSKLIDEQRLEAIRQDSQHFSQTIRAPALARRLVKEGTLTDWQQRMLLDGRSAFFLGKYKLLYPVGRGGMGIVFKAEHATMGRTVAIKVLPKQNMKNPTAVARFYQEIQTAAQLQDPHVVVAFDADCVGDTHFLVMEYVEGEDLQSVVDRRGKLFPEEACEYVRQAAMGLQHAHERGLVHRDIKPSNLMLTFSPRNEPVVKILDMGLAKFVKDEEAENPPVTNNDDSDNDRDDGLTRAGQVMGTPDYMAPEQAWNLKSADIRSDIFSLGCTLFEFLTGRLPFCGESITQKVLARSVLDAPSASQFLPNISPELDAVIAKMLARDPNDRFVTPSEVVAALEPFSVLPDEALDVVQRDKPAASEEPIETAQQTKTLDPQLDQFLNELAGESATAPPTRPRKRDTRRTTVFDEPSGNVKQFLKGLSSDSDSGGPSGERTESANQAVTEDATDVGELIQVCLTQRPTEQTLLTDVKRRKVADRVNLILAAVGLISFIVTIVAIYQWVM